MGKLLGVTAEEIEQDRRNQEGLPPTKPVPKEDKKDTAKPVAAELFDTGSDIQISLTLYINNLGRVPWTIFLSSLRKELCSFIGVFKI